MKTEGFKILLRSLLRALLVALISLLFLLCCQIPIPERSTVMGEIGVSYWNILIAFLAFGSVTRISRGGDRRARSRAVAAGRVSENFFRNLVYTVTDLGFWLDTIAFLLLSLLVGSPMYQHIKLAFFHGASANSVIALLFVPLIAQGILFLSRVIAYHKIRRDWARQAKVAEYYHGVRGQKRLARAKKKAKRSEGGAIAFDLLISFIGYMCAPAVLLVPSILIAPLIVLFTEYTSFSVAFLVVLAGFFVIRYVRAVRKRRSFVRDLTRVCAEKGISFTPVKHPYLSLFRETAGESFSLTYKGECYHCKLLGSPARAIQLLISGEGYAIRRRKIGIGRRMRVTLFNIDRQVDFSIEGEGRKALIILPVPHDVLSINEVGVTHPLDTGDSVGEWRVYSASGFLGALERDFLGRH